MMAPWDEAEWGFACDNRKNCNRGNRENAISMKSFFPMSLLYPHRRVLTLFTTYLLLFCAPSAWAFVPAEPTPEASRWQITTGGPTGIAGRPATLTWSIVPDGTQTFDTGTDSFSPSDLVATLDTAFGSGPGGTDYTQRPWFTYFEQSFERWEALSGLTYTYEPNDDGVLHGNTNAGALGVRGDVRVSGTGLDGADGTLAYNYFPSDGGDMALDTDDMGFFSSPANNFRAIRNIIMHEIGHGLGIDHTVSSNAAFLLEPNADTSFDGPQHDDLRGIQWLYGDALEKTNGGLGNETFQNAFDLGTLATAGPLAIGTSGTGTVIGENETDFVSIANTNDLDYFSFTTTEAVNLSLTLTPRGGQFDQSGTPFDTTATSDLWFTLYDTDGVTVLSGGNNEAIGVAESLDNLLLDTPGEYFVRVQSLGAVVQFYQLDLASTALPALLGDYNEDGLVDAADYTLYRDTLGMSVTPFSGADGDGDGLIDSDDYSVWASNFGSSTATGLAVPEPSGLLLLVGMLSFFQFRRGNHDGTTKS